MNDPVKSAAVPLPASVPVPGATGDEAEVARVMRICNACRYCEGFCAVFPAMTRRLDFGVADVHYLANLCHNCGACYYACQYAPPHEFALNVPRAMARVRQQTYAEFAWPRPLGALYRRNGALVALALALGLAAFLTLGLVLGNAGSQPANGSFYAVIPHAVMVMLFGLPFGWAVLALGIGAARFWRNAPPGEPSVPAVTEATRNVLALTYLDGGHGEGCNETDDRFTLIRRRLHHATFYGFLLCFASTTVATIYHYLLGRDAPYPFLSLPVLLGTVGGVGLVVGPLGLLWLNLRRDPALGDTAQRPMDRGFAILLLLASLTGLALLAWRSSTAMPTLLAVHLGVVMALFVTLPYGKFAHAVFRTAALLKWSIERRMPNRNLVKDD